MSMQSVRTSLWSYLQPVMIALAPLAVFIGNNIDIIKPAWMIRPILLLTSFALCIAFVCLRFFRDRQQGMVIASLITALILHSGLFLMEIEKLLSRFGIPGGLPWFEQDRQRLISVLGLAILVILIVMLNSGLKQHPAFLRSLAAVLTIAGLTFLISSIVIAVGAMLGSRQITADPTGVSAQDIRSLTPPDPLPDIYYIVLDSYPGKESLRQEFGFDNSSFLDYLEDRGFIVDNGALSNYYRSAFSISSTLNMDYIHDVAIRSEVSKLDGFMLSHSIRQSAIRRILSQFGYQTVAYSAGFTLTDIYDADEYHPESRSGMNPVETTILPWTAYAYVLPFVGEGCVSFYAPTYASHIQTIAGTLDSLESINTGDGPRFVIAHILAPHPPFVFDRSGDITIPPRPFGLDDAGGFRGSMEEYREGFAGQTAYINERFKVIIDNILNNSPRPSIIILQGDHGVRWQCDMDSAACDDIEIAYSILNARYLPGVEISENEVMLSPVNTFRLVLNLYFGGRISYLSDSTNISIGDWMFLDNIEPVEVHRRP